MLDIVIVNYNSSEWLLRCLRSVYDSVQGIPIQVYVQDNGSKDQIERVSRSFPEISLSKNKCNLGFAKAVNRGIRLGNAPYILLINPDSRIEKGSFFRKVISHMEVHKDIGILGPKIIDPNGNVQESARSFPTPFTGLFGRTSLLTKWFPNNSISRKNQITYRCKGKRAIEVNWVSGACMVIRRSAINDVGLFDERFFMYWEDADWCRRVWEKGWKVEYMPSVSISHEVGVSSSTAPLRSLIEFHKSAYKLFVKYHKFQGLIVGPVFISALVLRCSILSFFKLLKS